jgi:hypothetical protein
VSHRRGLWKCAERRKQFSVLVGTIVERSQVLLTKGLDARAGRQGDRQEFASHESVDHHAGEYV